MKNKYFANRGVKRNKKPLQNILYKIELVKELKSNPDNLEFDKFKYGDEGYLILNWQYEKFLNKFNMWNWHGFITPEKLKEKLGEKQWSKFRQGKRLFTIQRRVDGKNI